MGLVKAYKMDSCNIPRIATGFGAGMGMHGETCGAIVGAIMALGLKFGRDDASDLDAKKLTFSKVDQLLKAFSDEFKGIRCIDLTGCDMLTPEGLERSKAQNLHANVCPKFVAFAVEQAAKLIDA